MSPAQCGQDGREEATQESHACRAVQCPLRGHVRLGGSVSALHVSLEPVCWTLTHQKDDLRKTRLCYVHIWCPVVSRSKKKMLRETQRAVPATRRLAGPLAWPTASPIHAGTPREGVMMRRMGGTTQKSKFF